MSSLAHTAPTPPDPGPNKSLLDLVGHTPMLELRRIVPADCARILMKIEGANPTGSMKDRMALAMIRAGEISGRLMPGHRVVEYTGGSTGVSLAFVCAALGYPLDNREFRPKRSHVVTLFAAEGVRSYDAERVS